MSIGTKSDNDENSNKKPNVEPSKTLSENNPITIDTTKPHDEFELNTSISSNAVANPDDDIKMPPNAASFMQQSQFSASDVEMMKVLAKKMYEAKGKDNGGGNFKRILFFKDYPNVALAVMKSSSDESKKMLEKECQQLQYLSQQGLPAIAIHSDIFEIEEASTNHTNKTPKKHAAVLMEAVLKHTYIDGKSPGLSGLVFCAMLLGIEVPSDQEALNNQMENIKKSITNELVRISKNPNDEIPKLAQKAKQILQQLEAIRQTINTDKEQLIIGDLQLLVDTQGNIKIIDPIDVLKYDKTNDAYTSFSGQSTKVSTDFKIQMDETTALFDKMRKFCDKAAKMNNIGDLAGLIRNNVPQQQPNIQVRAHAVTTQFNYDKKKKEASMDKNTLGIQQQSKPNDTSTKENNVSPSNSKPNHPKHI